MKLKIVSDGTSANTIITDENGNKLENVRTAYWICRADDQLAELVIHLINVPAELVSERVIPVQKDDGISPGLSVSLESDKDKESND